MGIREWCLECGKPNPSISNYCPKCEAVQQRHREMVKAQMSTVDSFCKEAIKNGGFYHAGVNYRIESPEKQNIKLRMYSILKSILIDGESAGKFTLPVDLYEELKKI